MIRKTVLASAFATLLSVSALGAGWSLRPAQAAPVSISRSQASEGCDPSRSISVSGSSSVEIIPDQAMLSLGVQARADTADAAQTKVAATGKAIIAAIKAQGVDEKKISTDFFYAQPIYTSYEDRNIAHFQVDYSVGVMLTDVKKLDSIVSAAFRAGATDVRGVEFRTSQLRKYRDEARVAAMAAAYEKAQLLAKAGDAQVGCVLKIEEGAQSALYPWAYSGRANAISQNSVVNATGPAQGETGDDLFALGTMQVKAEVTVVYGMK